MSLLAACAVASSGPALARGADGNGVLTFCCAPENDLYTALARHGSVPRRATPDEAVRAAPDGSAVLLLADGYPETQTRIDPALLDSAREKHLRLYIEYPAALPGLTLGAPRKTPWERVVVASDAFGGALPKNRLLSVSDAHVLPVAADAPWLVTARVAGYDTAVYGLPASAAPVLFPLPGRDVLIATTKLSQFITGRYAPSADWRAVWERILTWLAPGAPTFRLDTPPVIRPAYRPDSRLPADVERKALSAAARWVFSSGLLLDAARAAEVESRLKAGEESAPPPDRFPHGDGRFGMQEGYASFIRADGRQLQRLPIRADCQAETAMVLAMDAGTNGTTRSRTAAENLLDYLYGASGMADGVRGDPEHPAFGLIAWGAVAPAWSVANYGDDNARVLMASMLTSAVLGSGRWDAPMLRALLANLRTTGRLGFRGDRIDIPALEQHGWKHFCDAETVNLSPHFEAYLWACYLWAYRQTGYAPFRDRTIAGIRRMMEGYPDGWRWQDNSERAQMLLPLAWLVRLEDTPEHRAWLRRVGEDLLATQQPCGAIPERFGGTGGGHYRIPASNEAYGTGETPLIQENGDPASDQLYTTGFALLGLHEAAAATGDAALKTAEDRLADYLCRIQTRSDRLPALSGTWFRAFDFRRWDYWASSADAGWGAWSIESGWGQAWIPAVLGLRAAKTSFWERTAGSRIGDHLETVMAEMSRNSGGPWTAKS